MCYTTSVQKRVVCTILFASRKLASEAAVVGFLHSGGRINPWQGPLARAPLDPRHHRPPKMLHGLLFLEGPCSYWALGFSLVSLMDNVTLVSTLSLSERSCVRHLTSYNPKTMCRMHCLKTLS